MGGCSNLLLLLLLQMCRSIKEGRKEGRREGRQKSQKTTNQSGSGSSTTSNMVSRNGRHKHKSTNKTKQNKTNSTVWNLLGNGTFFDCQDDTIHTLDTNNCRTSSDSFHGIFHLQQMSIWTKDCNGTIVGHGTFVFLFSSTTRATTTTIFVFCGMV